MIVLVSAQNLTVPISASFVANLNQKYDEIRWLWGGVMSDCRCSGTPAQHDTWDYHSEYCPVYLLGRIDELESENERLREALEVVAYWGLDNVDEQVRGMAKAALLEKADD